MAGDEMPDDESAEGYTSGPHAVLTDAGFDESQAAAIVECIRMCMEEEEAPAAPAPKGKGKGVDLALVFAGPGKKKG